MSCTSVSATHFRMKKIMFICSLLISSAIYCPAAADVIDRVVAVVNSTPITRSEFLETFQKSRAGSASITKQEALQLMINRLLIYQEAKKMRLEAPGIDEIIREYLDIRVESTIIIKEEDIEQFYNKNKDNFSGKAYLSVHDEIERYLYELEKNKRIKALIESLRSRSNISIRSLD